MDGHHLHVAFWERLIRVLVLIDAAVVEQAQEAVKEKEANNLPVAVRHNRVVVVVLEDVHELGEDGKVAGGVLVADGMLERLQREQW